MLLVVVYLRAAVRVVVAALSALLAACRYRCVAGKRWRGGRGRAVRPLVVAAGAICRMCRKALDCVLSQIKRPVSVQ